MGQPGGQLDFPEEPVGPDVVGDLGTEDFHGDLAIVAQVGREEDDRHAPLSDFAIEGVPAGETLSEAFQERGHRGLKMHSRLTIRQSSRE